MRYPTTDGFAGYGSPSRFEKHVVRTGVQQQAERAARARLHPHAAAPARRHHHAERLALRAAALGRARHRSRQAQAPDPRPGRPSADLHARYAGQISDGVAHLFPRMRRQQPAALSAQAGPGRRAAPARPDLLFGLDRRAALHAARGDRRQAECEMDRGGRRRRFRHGAQRAALQDHGRRVRRALPERRAAAAGERLSDAAVPARLPGQRAGEISAPHQGHRRSAPIPATRPRATRSRATTAPRCNSSW